MTGMNVNLRGFTQLNQRLMSLSKEQATKAGQVANRAGAAVIAKEAKANAPVSGVAEGATTTRHTKSGTTRVERHRKIINHIKVKKTRNSTVTQVSNSVSVGAYQAQFVEFGSIRQAPNPFLRKAFEASEQKIIDAMARVLEKQLVKRGV